ncbi:hypothetical protein THRCLA_04224 [Thraustotheca clavata]|uniref:PHD-type domain-containing protein n=1 Tax=Thraustotheca clavata TaxID=74557 RepID=A0A1V9ZZN7_9STRA|nr:hypothetical protein THRCLA_04224 [Thraustotheca clavata]
MPYSACIICGAASSHWHGYCIKCARSFGMEQKKRRRGEEEVIAIDSSDEESENKQNEQVSKPKSTKRTLNLDENEPRSKALKPNEQNTNKRKRNEADRASDEEKLPVPHKRTSKKPPPAIVEIQDLSDDEEESKGNQKKANILIPKRKNPALAIQTVEIFSSPLLKPRKRLPPAPSLGECSWNMLNFIESLAITPKSDDEDDEDVEEYEESYDQTDDPSVLLSETVDLTTSDDEESGYEKEVLEIDSEDSEEYDSSYEERRSKSRKRSKRRGRREMIKDYCYLCNKLMEKEPCLGCGRVFHNQCAREYGGGSDVICWECEEADIVNDDGLTEEGWDIARSVLEGLCPIKSEFPQPKSTENDNPFTTKSREVLERWRNFFDKTENFNEDFERATREIEENGGFSTSLENDLHKVFQHYTNEQIKAEAVENDTPTSEVISNPDPVVQDEPPRRKFFISQQVANTQQAPSTVVPSLFPEESEPSLSVDPSRPTTKYAIAVISGISQIVEQNTPENTKQTTAALLPPPVKKRITPMQIISKYPEPTKSTAAATVQTTPKGPYQGSSNNPIAMESDESESDSEEQRRTTRALAKSKSYSSSKNSLYLANSQHSRPKPSQPVVLTISDDDESDDGTSNSTTTISPALNVSLPKPSRIIDKAIAPENVGDNFVSPQGNNVKSIQREELKESKSPADTKNTTTNIVEAENNDSFVLGDNSVLESTKCESAITTGESPCIHDNTSLQSQKNIETNSPNKSTDCATAKQVRTILSIFSCENEKDKPLINFTESQATGDRVSLPNEDFGNIVETSPAKNGIFNTPSSPNPNILNQVTTANRKATQVESKSSSPKLLLTPAFTSPESPQSIDDPIETSPCVSTPTENVEISSSQMSTPPDNENCKMVAATPIAPTDERAKLQTHNADGLVPPPVFIIKPMTSNKKFIPILESSVSDVTPTKARTGAEIQYDSPTSILGLLSAKACEKYQSPPKMPPHSTSLQVESMTLAKDLYPCPPTIPVSSVNTCTESIVMTPNPLSSTFENYPSPPNLPSQVFTFQPIVQDKVSPSQEESPDIYPAPPSINSSMVQSTTAFEPYPSPPIMPPRSFNFEFTLSKPPVVTEVAYPKPPTLPSCTKTIPTPLYPSPPTIPELNNVVCAPLPSPPRLPSCASLQNSR